MRAILLLLSCECAFVNTHSQSKGSPVFRPAKGSHEVQDTRRARRKNTAKMKIDREGSGDDGDNKKTRKAAQGVHTRTRDLQAVNRPSSYHRYVASTAPGPRYSHRLCKPSRYPKTPAWANQSSSSSHGKQYA